MVYRLLLVRRTVKLLAVSSTGASWVIHKATRLLVGRTSLMEASQRLLDLLGVHVVVWGLHASLVEVRKLVRPKLTEQTLIHIMWLLIMIIVTIKRRLIHHDVLLRHSMMDSRMPAEVTLPVHMIWSLWIHLLYAVELVFNGHGRRITWVGCVEGLIVAKTV